MSKKRSYELPAESRRYLCSEVALSEDQHPASTSNSLGKSKDHLWGSSAILSIRVCLEGISDLCKTPTANNLSVDINVVMTKMCCTGSK